MSKPTSPDRTPQNDPENEAQLQLEEQIKKWLETVQERLERGVWPVQPGHALVLETFANGQSAFIVQSLLFPYFPEYTEERYLGIKTGTEQYIHGDFRARILQMEGDLNEAQLETVIHRYLHFVKNSPIELAKKITGKSEQDLKPYTNKHPGGKVVNLLDVFKNTPR